MHDFQEHCQTVFQGTDQFFFVTTSLQTNEQFSNFIICCKAKLILLINPRDEVDGIIQQYELSE